MPAKIRCVRLMRPRSKFPPLSSPPSTSNAERYQRIKEISSGGFGFVELCKNRQTGEYVAIKHLERGLKIDRNVLYEIMNHRNLLHHHVIKFKEVASLDAHQLLGSFMGGGDLRQLVTRRNGLSEREARWYFQQLVLGLDYCHQMGVANRDIKLDNTILDHRTWPLLKICDFGYSKHDKKHSQPGSRVGTPGYIAPEVIANPDGMKYDGKKADIWSCGACLYAMVFATYPFTNPEDRHLEQNDKIKCILERTVNEPFQVPLQPYVSPELRDLLNKIMVKEPEERISLEEIMHHPWFQKDLPRGAMDMNAHLNEQRNGIQSEAEIRSLIEAAKIPFTGNEFGAEFVDRRLL